EKDLVEKEIRGREETSKIRSVRKLFTPEGNKTGSSPGDPITARMTSTGNYKVSPKKRDKTPSNLVGSNIPKYLTDIFHPANQMELNDVECHLAAYIFSPQINKKIDENETMVSTEIDYTIGTRKLLQCLRPNQTIGQDVIDLVATMLTHDERSNSKIPRYVDNWFLPSTLSQFVLTTDSPKESMMKGYRKRFMGNADFISKSRFMEEWLMDPSFYDLQTTRGPKISEFKIAAPSGYGSQGQDSWMKAQDYKLHCN
ncbi:hypothetical protein L195_g039370, partial [Trifolium pratense]